MDASDRWEPGSVAQDPVPGGAEQLFYLDTTPLRRAARFLMWSALAGFAGVVALAALIAAVIPHTVLVVILIVLAAPVVLLALVTAAVVWVARRAWRNGTCMALVPMAPGRWRGAPGRSLVFPAPSGTARMPGRPGTGGRGGQPVEQVVRVEGDRRLVAVEARRHPFDRPRPALGLRLQGHGALVEREPDR